MEVIKERITQVLDNKGVLARLKAELRANVFLAINDQDIKQGGVGLSRTSNGMRREELLADPAGVLVVELVREFLRWCNLQFTLQVFDPEMQLPSAALDSGNLAQQLGLGGTGPLLLQLLNQYLQHAPQQGPPQTGTAAREALAAPAEAAVVAVLPANNSTTNSTLAYNPQQQHAGSAGALQPPAAVTKQVQGAADVAVMKQVSKSASIVEDIDFEDEGLINTHLAHEDNNEEYTTVFLAAQRHSAGSAHDSEGSGSSNSIVPQQQQPRPVRGMNGLTSAAHEQASQVVEAAKDLSDSFGNLDRSPASLSLELHGLESQPQALCAAASPPTPAAGAVAAAGSPGSLDNIPGVGSFISPANSFMDMHPQQHMDPLPAAAALPGRPAQLEPLGPVRLHKLVPLGPVKGPSLVVTNSGGSSAPVRVSSSKDLKEELRRAGLIGSAGSSPDASISTSPQGQAAQHALHDCHGLDGTGNPAAVTAAAPVQQRADGGTDRTNQGQESGMVPHPAAAAGGTVHGSAVADEDSSDDDSDDFGLSTTELFAAARRQLSQSGPQQQQQHLEQQQQAAVQSASVSDAKWVNGGSVGDSDDIIDDIPEDFSGNLPLGDLEEADVTAVYNTGVAVTGTKATAAAGAGDHLGMSMDLHNTGLSLSDRLGGIAGLTSADLLDEDDF